MQPDTPMVVGLSLSTFLTGGLLIAVTDTWPEAVGGFAMGMAVIGLLHAGHAEVLRR